MSGHELPTGESVGEIIFNFLLEIQLSSVHMMNINVFIARINIDMVLWIDILVIFYILKKFEL